MNLILAKVNYTMSFSFENIIFSFFQNNVNIYFKKLYFYLYI